MKRTEKVTKNVTKTPNPSPVISEKSHSVTPDERQSETEATETGSSMDEREIVEFETENDESDQTEGEENERENDLNHEINQMKNEISQMMGALNLNKEYAVETTMNKKPMSAFEIMLKNSNVTAVGRRMFDNTEIHEEKETEVRKSEPDIKSVEPRYLKVFEKKTDKKEDKSSAKLMRSLRIMKEHPREFGLWDEVHDPVSVASTLEKRPKRKAKTPSFEEKVRIAQIEAERRAADDENDEIHDKIEPRTSLKSHEPTGKYLHESDILWCQRHTKMGQQSVIKWFKRFRKVCCPKGKLSCKGLGMIFKRLYEANGDVFATIIFKLYKQNVRVGSLDFKVFFSHFASLLHFFEKIKRENCCIWRLFNCIGPARKFIQGCSEILN